MDHFYIGVMGHYYFGANNRRTCFESAPRNVCTSAIPSALWDHKTVDIVKSGVRDAFSRGSSNVPPRIAGTNEQASAHEKTELDENEGN